MNSIRISIIEQRDFSPNKDFTIFTIGSTIEHGIHWVVSSAEPFILVWWSHRPHCIDSYGCWILPLTFAMCAYFWRRSFRRWPHWSRTCWPKRYTWVWSSTFKIYIPVNESFSFALLDGFRALVLDWWQLQWSQSFPVIYHVQWPVLMIMKASQSSACCSPTTCG